MGLAFPPATQLAKTTLFASGNEADVRKSAAGDFFQCTWNLSDLRFLLLRSWQKPRFLPAETKLVSEKAPQATFSNILE
jgi:hypothetical protein